MSLSSEITRLQNAKSALKTSIEVKGVTVSDSTLISGYAALVDEIQTGGGGGGNEDVIDLIERDITTLNIPSGTTKIGDYAFRNCSRLTSVTIPNSVTKIGESAFYGTSLTIIDIPNSVTYIDNNAFSNCYNLTSVTIPNSVTSIGNSTFSYCYNLTSVSIPNSVESIGYSAFSHSDKLTSITINATTPPSLGSSAFSSTNDCPIYVPAESVDAYKTATNWSTYASRIQAIPTE